MQKKAPIKLDDIPVLESLEQLEARRIWVVLQWGYADANTGQPRAVRLPLYEPTYHEWHLWGAEVPEPKIPRTLTKGGDPVPNPLDNEYLKQKAEAEVERSYRRLIYCLEKAGIKVPGEDIAEKVTAFKDTVDAGVANTLLTYLKAAASGTLLRLDTLIETF